MSWMMAQAQSHLAPNLVEPHPDAPIRMLTAMTSTGNATRNSRPRLGASSCRAATCVAALHEVERYSGVDAHPKRDAAINKPAEETLLIGESGRRKDRVILGAKGCASPTSMLQCSAHICAWSLGMTCAPAKLETCLGERRHALPATPSEEEMEEEKPQRTPAPRLGRAAAPIPPNFGQAPEEELLPVVQELHRQLGAIVEEEHMV